MKNFNKIRNIIRLLKNNTFIFGVKDFFIRKLIKIDISDLDVSERKRLCISSIEGIIGVDEYDSEELSDINFLCETVIKYFYGVEDISSLSLSLLSDLNSISYLLDDSLIEKIYGVKDDSDIYKLMGYFLTDIRYINYVDSYVDKKIYSLCNSSIDSIYELFKVLLSSNISFDIRKKYIDMLLNNKSLEDKVYLVCDLLVSGTSNMGYLFSIIFEELIKSDNVNLIIKFLTSYYDDKSLYKDIYRVEINALILVARKKASKEELDSLYGANRRLKDFRLDSLNDKEKIELLRKSVNDNDYKSLEYKVITKSDTLDDNIKSLYSVLSGTYPLNSLLVHLERVLRSSDCNLDNEMYQYTLLVIFKKIISYKNIDMNSFADRFIPYFLTSDIITIKSIKIIDLLITYVSRDEYISLFCDNLISFKNKYGLVSISKVLSYMKNSSVYVSWFIKYLVNNDISDDELSILIDYFEDTNGIIYNYIINNIDRVNYDLIIRFINKNGKFDLLALTKKLLSRSDIDNKDIMIIDILINSSLIVCDDIDGFLYLIGFNPDGLKTSNVNSYIKSLLSSDISNSGYDKAVYLLSYLFHEKYSNKKRPSF